eukprot:m.547917 g.547917  ORF g.547917 m.547917 type:complete len:76 (-) comp57709_c0_seq8:258-485(-)
MEVVHPCPAALLVSLLRFVSTLPLTNQTDRRFLGVRSLLAWFCLVPDSHGQALCEVVFRMCIRITWHSFYKSMPT